MSLHTSLPALYLAASEGDDRNNLGAARALQSFTEATSDWSLQLLDWLLMGVGMNPETFPGGVAGRSIVAFLILLPLIGFTVWFVAKLLRAFIQRLNNPTVEGESTLRAIIASLIRPLGLLIWVYGIFIAAAPLMTRLSQWFESDRPYLIANLFVIAATFIAAVWFLLTLVRHLRRAAESWAEKTPGIWDDIAVPLVAQSLNVIIPLLAAAVFFEFIQMPEEWLRTTSVMTSIVVILIIAWVLVQFVLSLDDIILKMYDLKAADNLRARTIFTQVHVIQRIALVVIGVLSLASILMIFPDVRRLGQTILASAGVFSIIAGLAMQRSLGNLFAGIQIAFTQPIRLDDVVIVENEWGWIEEITLTYVVVKIWDWRRLVLPISYFIEKPFQNWTRSSASIIGTVFMYVDYKIPVDDLREEFEKIVKAHPLWDGQVYCLQVTELKEHTIELRVLLSAVDSPKAWDIRCDVREAMLEYVQATYPDCLPVIRLENAREERLDDPQRSGIDRFTGPNKARHLSADKHAATEAASAKQAKAE